MLLKGMGILLFLKKKKNKDRGDEKEFWVSSHV